MRKMLHLSQLKVLIALFDMAFLLLTCLNFFCVQQVIRHNPAPLETGKPYSHDYLCKGHWLPTQWLLAWHKDNGYARLKVCTRGELCFEIYYLLK